MQRRTKVPGDGRGPDTVHRRARRTELRRLVRRSATAIIALVVAPVVAGVVLYVVTKGDSAPPPGPAGEFRALESEHLTVSVNPLTQTAGCEVRWLVPRPPDDITFREDGRTWRESSGDFSEHPAGEGGASASPLVVYITVQGTSETEVTITDIVPHVERRGAAPAGTQLSNECGDTGEYRWMIVDLDDPSAPVHPSFHEELAAASEAPDEQKVPIRFPYEVSRSDAESFRVEAHTVACDCAWWLELHSQAAGESDVLRIDDQGEPFRTMGTAAAYASCQADGSCSATGEEG